MEKKLTKKELLKIEKEQKAILMEQQRQKHLQYIKENFYMDADVYFSKSLLLKLVGKKAFETYFFNTGQTGRSKNSYKQYTIYYSLADVLEHHKNGNIKLSEITEKKFDAHPPLLSALQKYVYNSLVDKAKQNITNETKKTTKI